MNNLLIQVYFESKYDYFWSTFYPLFKQLFMNIFVGSLPFKIEESELQEIFEEYGAVTSVKRVGRKW